MILYKRLFEGLKKFLPDDKQRHNHIITNMIYMTEINSTFIPLLKQLFGEKSNVFNVDFLKIPENPQKWVRKYALEMNLKYIEFNPAHTSRTLYSGMDDEYYDRPYHPTQPLHQYDCIVHNSDKIVYFGEITRKEFNHFNRLLNKWKKKASFVQ